MAGDMSRHFPTLIHSVSIGPSIELEEAAVGSASVAPNPGAVAIRYPTSLAFRTFLQCEMGRY